jgi:hypothetical protein
MTASGARTSSGVPGGSAEREADVAAQFPADIESPRKARHFVIGVLREWGFSRDARDEATLVTTELATNAVLHADSGFSVVLVEGDGVVRIAVCDAVPLDPSRLVVGLGLVDRVSRDWGVDVTANGKTVWAEIGPMCPG